MAEYLKRCALSRFVPHCQPLLTISKHLLSLASRTNSEPLPPISETYGVRLPPLKHCLTAVDFDLVPNKPPPEDVVKLEDDDEEESEEEEEEDPVSPTRPDEEMELAEPSNIADVQPPSDLSGLASGIRMSEEAGEGEEVLAPPKEEEEEEAGSDDDDDGLFGDDGADDDDDDDDMEMVDIQTTVVDAAPATNGTPQVGEKRKLSEDDEYD